MSDVVSTESMTVIRDQHHNVINIGEWNYGIYTDDDGNEVVTNPLPAGSIVKTENVDTYSDNSRDTTQA